VVVVRDAETKAPIPGAEVHLLSTTDISRDLAAATTGPDGSVQLAIQPSKEGGLMAEVHAAGYQTGEQDVTILKTQNQAVVEVFSGTRPTVELVLPPGFRGQVTAKVRVQPDAPPGRREFAFEVPTSGTVEVTGPAILGHPLGPEFRARYPDGTQLPKDAPDEVIAFRYLRTDGQDQLFVVGTRMEWEEVRKAHNHDLPRSRRGSGGPRVGGGGGGRGGGRHGGGGGGGGFGGR
jgi:hypothetical protein